MVPESSDANPDGDLSTFHGYTEEHAYLWICGTCYGLKELGRPDGLNQHCECDAEARRSEARWPRFDFNERAMLCRCCGVHVLDSGSRWSIYFCRECQLLAMGVSVWHRQLVFPIGRHTAMNTYVSAPRSSAGEDYDENGRPLPETVYRVLKLGMSTSEVIWDWYRMVMPLNLERLGMRGEVWLKEYVQAVDREKLDVLQTRLRSFDSLCDLMRRRSATS